MTGEKAGSAVRSDRVSASCASRRFSSTLDSTGDARIGSRYRGQTDPTASRYFADFDRTRIRR